MVQWSGIAYGITFLGAGAMAPLWGRFADLYGRKLFLIRASFAMALGIALTGTVQHIWQLVAVRLLIGLLGGYASGAVVLVATQTPKARAGWALGTLSTGAMAGNLIGPLLGGALPALVGIRQSFFLAGGVIFVAFLATCLLIREDVRPGPVEGSAPPRRLVDDTRPPPRDRDAGHRRLADGCPHVDRADQSRSMSRR